MRVIEESSLEVQIFSQLAECLPSKLQVQHQHQNKVRDLCFLERGVQVGHVCGISTQFIVGYLNIVLFLVKQRAYNIFKISSLHNIQLQNSKQQRHYIYASQKSIYVYQYNTNENTMLMTIAQHNLNALPQNTLYSSLKKKYSKVNQSIRDRFLSFIIQHNMSIKEASQTLNINYSSAKAILASHRKKINGPKKDGKQRPYALYRSLNQLQDSFSRFSVICSTGGSQTSRYGDIGKVKQIHKSSISPVIVLKMQKQVQSSDHTINNSSN